VAHSPDSLHGRLLKRLELVRADLLEAMGRLSDADLPWAPTEGMRTVDGLFREIAGTEVALLDALQGKKARSFGAIEKRFLATTVEEWRGVLAGVRAETVAFIEARSEEELEAPVRLPKGWPESLGLDEVPTSEPLRTLAAHEWYHTGQLVSYLWSRGDDPYEWS
jgi:uncharacterized damage-inducible protein DinB